jgi:hypothetical protein
MAVSVSNEFGCGIDGGVGGYFKLDGGDCAENPGSGSVGERRVSDCLKESLRLG